MKAIMVELGVAVPLGGGDHGTWNTAFVEIPGDTPEDQIEAVAMETYERQLQCHPSEIAHMWLYHWSYPDEDEDETSNH